MISEFDLSPSSEPSSPSHSQESQRRKCKYQGRVSTWIIFKTVQKHCRFDSEYRNYRSICSTFRIAEHLAPSFSSKFHPNPKNKNNTGELGGSDGEDQAKGSRDQKRRRPAEELDFFFAKIFYVGQDFLRFP